MGASMPTTFESFFNELTEGFDPYEWQKQIARVGLPDVLPVPTGLGKTEGVVIAWAWRRLLVRTDEPMHLVFCLPMRSLVAQTVDRIQKYFDVLRVKLARLSQLGGGTAGKCLILLGERP